MQTAHRNVAATRTEMIGDHIGPVRRRDVGLHDEKVGCLQLGYHDPFDVLVEQGHLVVRTQVSR